MENLLGTKYPKFKEFGQAILDDIAKAINTGKVTFAGLGTLKKGQPAMKIYRGNGVTIVTTCNDEFVTILEPGQGLDLGILML